MIYVSDHWSVSSDGSQYRWFLVTYQVGVFSARTFGSLLPARSTWWAPIAQMLNAIFFIYAATAPKSTNIFVVFGFVFCLGCVGGICFVHSFMRVIELMPSSQHKFSLGILTIAESCGITIGGLFAVSIHNVMCKNFV